MSITLLVLMYLVVYPYFAMRGIALILALIMSGLATGLYKVNYLLVLFIWLLSVALPLLFQMTSYEGNYNHALAGHFLNYQLVAISLSSMLSAYKLRKRTLAL